MSKTQNQKKEVKSFFILLLSSVLAAFLITFGMVWHYNPEGKILLNEALLSPETLQTLSKKNQSGFVFSQVEFNGKPVPFESYKDFYHLIEMDKSLMEIAIAIDEQFIKQGPDVVTLVMKQANGEASFQSVQIIDDYYRVQLRDSQKRPFATFRHQNIRQEAKKVFSQ
jgi:hypothetical protein